MYQVRGCLVVLRWGGSRGSPQCGSALVKGHLGPTLIQSFYIELAYASRSRLDMPADPVPSRAPSPNRLCNALLAGLDRASGSAPSIENMLTLSTYLRLMNLFPLPS